MNVINVYIIEDKWKYNFSMNNLNIFTSLGNLWAYIYYTEKLNFMLLCFLS